MFGQLHCWEYIDAIDPINAGSVFAGIHMEIVLYIWDAAMVTVELHALNSNLVVWNMSQSCGDPNV